MESVTKEQSVVVSRSTTEARGIRGNRKTRSVSWKSVNKEEN